MPPHRNIPMQGTTVPSKIMKPERTVRSHEENQERAYIAASRRSDRSLEARVESARRASDIHKKRTGRALRVTEQDVMNEEMYEEEDDDIPWRYRSVTSHLPLEDGLLSRRIQSMLAVQLENQRLLGQAVNSTLQHNPQFQHPSQFVSPGMMQMSANNMFQSPMNMMMPPQQHLNRTSSSYRHTPYPIQQSQSQARPNMHQRSASIATPQEQYQQAAMPVSAGQHHDRRMSLPQNVAQQKLPQQLQPAVQRAASNSQPASAPTTPSYPNHASVSPELRMRPQPSPTTASTSQQPTPQLEQNNPFAPLTTTLPMDTQQLLAGSENYPSFDMFGQMSDYPIKPQQPFYSYKPNHPIASLKNNSQSNAVGLDQTLLGNPINTSIAGDQHSTYADTPSSASSGPLYSASTEPGYGFGFDGSMFSLDPFAGSGMSSGHVTPGTAHGYNEPMFNDFLEQDMFGDMQSSQV